jgi:hypothetical protein
MFGSSVSRVNGHSISTLAELSEALEKPCGDHHVIEIEHHNQRNELQPSGDFGTLIVLDADLVEQATAEALQLLGATEASSD